MNRFKKIKHVVEKSIMDAYTGEVFSSRRLLDELNHFYLVVNWCQYLASRRGYSAEIAGVIGVLHDIGRITEDYSGEKHALKGSKIAKKLLEETEQFTSKEIKIIKEAVKYHNKKLIYTDEPYVELIKDADLLARYFENTDDFYGKNKIKRLNLLKKELYPAGFTEDIDKILYKNTIKGFKPLREKR